jgi:hypothetical protein
MFLSYSFAIKIGVKGKHAMSSNSKKYTRPHRELSAMLIRQNQAAIALRHQENRMALQGLAFGILSGAGLRVTWELGIISDAVLKLEIAATSIWIVLCDLTTACSGLVRALFAG